MKKIIALCFIFLIGFISMGSLKAQETSQMPVGINYLSLSNLLAYTNDGSLGVTVNPIAVLSNTNYTIVIDIDYFGGDINFDHIAEVELIPADGYACDIDIQFFYNEAHSVAHGTMNTYGCQLIHLKNIPLPKTTNYNIVMIKGTFDQFVGFEPYLSQNEVLVYEGFLAVDYDDLYDTSDIKVLITAKDALGHDISYDTIEDTYSISQKLPGTYHMRFSASQHLITKQLFLDIRVFDLTAPKIILPEALEIPLAHKLTLSDIKALILVTDNVDILDAQDLVIITDTYSSADQVGTYTIEVSITDSSGNITHETLSVSLIDRLGPVITGPKQIYLYTTDDTLTDFQIIEKYQAIDDVDGPHVSFTISLNTYLQTKTPGIYDLTLEAIDSNQNITNYGVKIHVIENRGPEFFMAGLILEMTTKQLMTEQEIIDWFKNQAVSSGYQVSHVRVLFNEYKDSEKAQGTYYVYLSYDLDQDTYTTRVKVDVGAAQSSDIWLPISIGSMLLVIGATTLFILKRKK